MENIPQANNPEYICSDMSQLVIQNQQIPTSNQGNHNYNQQHVRQNMSTPALPNLPPVFDVGNTYSNLNNITTNMPHSFPDPGNSLFNMGTSGSNKGNGGNVAPRTKPRGRPFGSKNKAKVYVSPNVGLSVPVVVLEVPPECDIISWLLDYAHSRKVTLTVLGGFGFISEVVVLKHFNSQPLLRIYSGKSMTMMSISGTYIFSPERPSRSDSFFNATVATESGQVAAGAALKILTVGHVVLTVAILGNPQNPVNIIHS